jgi:hypothetical protein
MTRSDVPDDDPLFRETTERFGVFRLVTEVRSDGLSVRFEPIQRSFRTLPASRIREVRVASYAASRYAGWHWGVRRTPGGNTVYRLQGNQGVELVLTDDTHWFVGSRHPEELAAAVARLLTPED